MLELNEFKEVNNEFECIVNDFMNICGYNIEDAEKHAYNVLIYENEYNSILRY